METEINGIIIAGKVYERKPSERPGYCDGCAFANFDCVFADYCCAHESIFRFSPELTEKLKGE